MNWSARPKAHDMRLESFSCRSQRSAPQMIDGGTGIRRSSGLGIMPYEGSGIVYITEISVHPVSQKGGFTRAPLMLEVLWAKPLPRRGTCYTETVDRNLCQVHMGDFS